MKSVFVAGALFAAGVVADTSLYIPGFDPQQITADIEGVDSSGHTTWRIGPGLTSGTFEDAPGIAASATLVAGATDAHLVYDDPTNSLFLSEDCGIQNGLAACTVVVSVEGNIVTSQVTETASAFEIQGDATAAPTGTGASAASGATAGSSVTSGASATDSANATPTSTANGSGRVTASAALTVVFVGLVSAFCL